MNIKWIANKKRYFYNIHADSEIFFCNLHSHILSLSPSNPVLMQCVNDERAIIVFKLLLCVGATYIRIKSKKKYFITASSPRTLNINYNLINEDFLAVKNTQQHKQQRDDIHLIEKALKLCIIYDRVKFSVHTEN